MPLLGRRVARFNKLVTNRIQRPIARYLPPYAVVVHTGRSSGRTYRTPVTALVSKGRVVIALAYGDQTDWVRNLVAADGGELIRGGRTLKLARPRIVTAKQRKELPRRARVPARVTRKMLVADVSRRG
jgi:deazaflavin-dependent oxidoreductase (nitroreductase family)